MFVCLCLCLCPLPAGVADVLKRFHSAGKPIGLCCISPVLAAKVIPGVTVTVGGEEEEGGVWPYAGTAGAIKGTRMCVCVWRADVCGIVWEGVRV